MLSPDAAITSVRGVGEKRAVALRELGIETVLDALRHLPFRYDDRRSVVRAADIGRAEPGAPLVVAGEIKGLSVARAKGRPLYIATFDLDDGSAQVRAAFFGGARSFWDLREGKSVALWGVPELRQLSRGRWIYEMKSPERVDAPGGEPPHEWACLAPVYRACAGVPRSWLAKIIRSLVMSEADLAPLSGDASDAAERRGLMPTAAALRAIHAPSSHEEADAARRALAFAELFDDQRRRMRSRDARGTSEAPSLASGASAAREFCESLPFALTPSQRSAIDEITSDISLAHPMRRLLHGDVGSGKTIVALACACACAASGHQAAILVPTTVLSAQFVAACERYIASRATFAELRGGAPKRERRETLDALEQGEISILIGTHAMLEDDVKFARLGLMIIDEQHRFGVRQREAIEARELGASGVCPHVLMMSATPIPRTLSMTLYGDISLSALRERPPGRRAVATRPVSANHIDDVYSFLRDAATRGERAYWVCPIVDGDDGSVASRADDIRRRSGGLRARELTGAMPNAEKRDAVDSLARGDVDVLVSTTVVEVGIDVRDATIIVIEGATKFGLSTLHQLRGRVGRGSRGGICILLDEAREIASSEKIKIMTEIDDGFAIAEEDLRLRGAGDASGTAQHGFESFYAADPLRDIDLIRMARDDAELYTR